MEWPFSRPRVVRTVAQWQSGGLISRWSLVRSQPVLDGPVLRRRPELEPRLNRLGIGFDSRQVQWQCVDHPANPEGEGCKNSG